MKIPCFAYPDPRYAAEDEAERQRVENEIRAIKGTNTLNLINKR